MKHLYNWKKIMTKVAKRRQRKGRRLARRLKGPTTEEEKTRKGGWTLRGFIKGLKNCG